MNTTEPTGRGGQGRESARSEPVHALERPAPALLVYYLALSCVAGPFFFVPLLFFWFKYRTLRYRFDEEGVSMRWGALFRREVHLTYARIQDIHLVSNVVERWLDLARIRIQTASGSAKAEMTLEGLHEFEEVRDFLYSRMRGQGDGRAAGADDDASELASELRRATAELTEIRRLMTGRGSE